MSDHIYKIRRQNVNQIIDLQFGGVTKRFADAVGKSPAHISNLTREKKPDTIGDRVARDFEESLGLTRGCLDGLDATDMQADIETEAMIQEAIRNVIKKRGRKGRTIEAKRDELLRVATQLAAGMNVNGCTDAGALYNFNQQAVLAAKDLIEKVDAEVGL